VYCVGQLLSPPKLYQVLRLEFQSDKVVLFLLRSCPKPVLINGKYAIGTTLSRERPKQTEIPASGALEIKGQLYLSQNFSCQKNILSIYV
jgi:hypothetical protein